MSARRTALSIGVATLCGWLAAVSHAGFLHVETSPESKLALVVGGGVAAACVRGRSWLARRVYAMPFLLYSGLLVLSTSLYASGRSSMLTVELLVPATASALPFSVAYRAAGRTLARATASRTDLRDD